jgi:phage major head subunit gpT-like protein
MTILILVDYEATVKEACMKLKNSAKQMELTIYQEKTKRMEVSNNKTKEKHIIIDNIYRNGKSISIP